MHDTFELINIDQQSAQNELNQVRNDIQCAGHISPGLQVRPNHAAQKMFDLSCRITDLSPPDTL